jgi:hypothetical protein
MEPELSHQFIRDTAFFASSTRQKLNEQAYLQALKVLLSSRSPMALDPLASRMSQTDLMTLKQFRLSDCKLVGCDNQLIKHLSFLEILAWDKDKSSINLTKMSIVG